MAIKVNKGFITIPIFCQWKSADCGIQDGLAQN
jgi:hypothetical protein